jgi:hypothetical protein
MAFLADDLLEGRETGTRGYQLAANYVRAQFEQMGLEPAGNNGTYFQSIHFRKLTPQPERDSFVIHRPSGELKLAVEKNYLMAGDAAREDTSVEGGMVFVGYGMISLMQIDSRFDPLRSDSRFGALVRRIGLVTTPTGVSP